MPPAARKPRARRIPPKSPLTAEAKAELLRNGIPEHGTDSANVYAPPAETDNPVAEQIYLTPAGEPATETSSDEIGSLIDQAVAQSDDKPLIDPEKPQPADTKTGPPSVDEWLDFFSRIVLKIGCELYIDFAFRGIDEKIVTAEDLQRVQLRKNERDSLARPFAQFANKSKYARKHGRQIVALTDSVESAVTLGIWARRVNRIAKKYRPVKTTPVRPQNVRIMNNGDIGQATPNGVNGARGGHIPDGYGVYNPGSG